jgi:hypothetical protein
MGGEVAMPLPIAAKTGARGGGLKSYWALAPYTPFALES